jgi:T5SS/PEP-CTERM-associated repeat protein/autotransporter-associated beta strand protein
MKPSHTPAPPLPATVPQKPHHPLRPAIATTLLLLCIASPLQAAITWTGDIDPLDPTTWTPITNGYIGKSSTGSITIDGSSGLQSDDGYLGYNSGSSGTATVSGTGSKWSNQYLYIGNSGIGTLNIEAGGRVYSESGYLGYESGSSGAVTVTGTDSKWANSWDLYVGNKGIGILNIEAGGQVSSSFDGYLGYESGSSGSVIVTGIGSTWTTSHDLYVGKSGTGSQTVNDGGKVIVGGTLYASSDSLLGNGTISAKGGVVDADLIFDAAHGSQTTSIFGSGGTLTIIQSAKNPLGVGYKSNGTISITEGVSVASSDGFLGYNSGSSGTAIVHGSGTTWTCNNTLYVGNSGTGTLNIDAGGQVSCAYGSVGYKSGSSGTVRVSGIGSTWTNSGNLYIGYSGTGCLNIQAGGQVSNSSASCIGFTSGSTGTVTVIGTGSKWIDNDYLHIGDSGEGTLNIEAGGLVSNTDGIIGNNPGSSGKATVTGIGSIWTNSDELDVGYQGNGTLKIEAGGQVSNTIAYIGKNLGSTGAVTVTGAGSKWINSSDLYVGNEGSGTLTVNDGGAVVVSGAIYASSNSLRGNGTISANGGMLDADFVFDAAHGSQATSIFGSGGTVTITPSASNPLGVGYGGTGSLRISDGVTVSSSSGYLGYYPGSFGTATVTGAGSKWINSGDLYVGKEGNGTLTVNDGGTVVVGGAIYASNLMGNGTISAKGGLVDVDLVFDAAHKSQTTSKFGSDGALTIMQSSSNPLGVGYKGTGTLRITEGVKVFSSNGYLGYYPDSSGTATVAGTGSTWTNYSSLFVGRSGTGTLNIEAGGVVRSSSGYIGYNSGSSGTVTVTGTGSEWRNYNSPLYVGNSGTGILNIEAGGQFSGSDDCYIGYNSGSSGSVTVTGIGSKWTDYWLYVGYQGKGTLTVKDGGTVVVNGLIFASLDCLQGNGTISANGGVLDADLVFDSVNGLPLSLTFGSGGTLTLNRTGTLGAGYKGKGSLRITDGAAVTSGYGYLGYISGSYGAATVAGSESKWTNIYDLSVGYEGVGILNIEAGAKVRSLNCCLGGFSGSSGTAAVSGIGSSLSYGSLYIGSSGTGTLNIEAGGVVVGDPDSNNNSVYQTNFIGIKPGSTGTVRVTGTGSKWTCNSDLIVGWAGSGILKIEAGGQVSNISGIVGQLHDSTGSVTVTGNGSIWTNSGGLYIGAGGTGTMTIESGGQVNSTGSSGVGGSSGSTSTVTVTGAGSRWGISDSSTRKGSFSIGNGTLNIGSGIASDGLVSASSLSLSYSTSSTGICNLNGGTLQTSSITKGSGSATFNWSDGTIRNYNASTDLTVNGTNNLSLKLAANGTHAFYIDAGRKGTISAILSDATSGGTLEKQGAGLLTLSGANTYTGGTTIAAGTLALSSAGSLASTPIDVKSGATFDVSVKKGYSLAAGKTLTGSGTIVGDLSVSGIHAPGNSTGIETVKGNYSLLGELQIELAGTAAGTGYDEVLISGSSAYNAALSGTLSLDWTNFTGSTDATQLWIVKNDTAGTLSGAFSNYVSGASLGLHDGRSWNLYYNADAATGNLTGGNDVLIAPVPEPTTIVLLALSALAALVWRRKSRVGQA